MSSTNNSDKDCHFILLPVNHMVCGKPHQSIYEITFTFDERVDNGSIEVLSVVDIDERGRMNDVTYLAHEDIKGLDTTLLNCIYYNSTYWNVRSNWWNE